MNHSNILIIAILILSLAGVASVAYIAVQISSTTDKVFFAGVITAFLVPTVTALMAILRGESVVKTVNRLVDKANKKE